MKMSRYSIILPIFSSFLFSSILWKLHHIINLSFALILTCLSFMYRLICHLQSSKRNLGRQRMNFISCQNGNKTNSKWQFSCSELNYTSPSVSSVHFKLQLEGTLVIVKVYIFFPWHCYLCFISQGACYLFCSKKLNIWKWKGTAWAFFLLFLLI